MHPNAQSENACIWSTVTQQPNLSNATDNAKLKRKIDSM